jgi:Flp pilus assembly protein CpaB
MIIAAVLFAAIAAVLLFAALQSRDGGGSSAATDTFDVVVAANNIDANTTLTAGMLTIRAVPADDALAGVYSTIPAAVGLPARYPLQQGEQVTADKVGLQAITDEKDLALVLKSGQRGFAVEATEVTAVGGLLLPGNSVDVIAVFGEETGGIEKAVTVLQNIDVLGVAQEAQEPVPAAGDATDGEGAGIRGQRPDDVERQPAARSVTLAVTPEQAQLLASLQAQDDVEIWLSLRPLDDDENAQLNDTNLFQYHSPPLPEPQP